MEKKVYDLTVDPELESVAPPLAESELEILKEDILANGCQIPLIVWGETIVDGHNRYRICKEEGIPFGIEQMEFENLTAAKLWIVRNQLGRRNLTEFQRCELIYPFETELKDIAEKRRVALRAAGVPTLAHEKKTRDVMADMAGVSHGTWDKAKKVIAEGDEVMKEKLRSGGMKIHTAFNAIRKKEKPAAEPEGEPIVAAHLEGSIPFEPVQRDATPEEIEKAFTAMLDDWREDMEELLDKLTEENTTDKLIAALRHKLTTFCKEMDKAIGRED